jgi:hypothetical protein
VNANSLTPSEHRDYARELYAVEGVRVTLDMYRGWQCTCAVYVEKHECAHVVQAQAFRQMRGVKREDDTIELHCTPAQLQELARAAEEREKEERTEIVPALPPVRPAGRPVRLGRERRRSSWTTVGAAAALSAVSSGVTYLATTWAQGNRSEPRLSQVLLAPVPAPATSPAQEPVRFVNPFDSKEVFLFPAGTSQVEARDAVAEFLLERARERAAEAESLSAQTG